MQARTSTAARQRWEVHTDAATALAHLAAVWTYVPLSKRVREQAPVATLPLLAPREIKTNKLRSNSRDAHGGVLHVGVGLGVDVRTDVC